MIPRHLRKKRASDVSRPVFDENEQPKVIGTSAQVERADARYFEHWSEMGKSMPIVFGFRPNEERGKRR